MTTPAVPTGSLTHHQANELRDRLTAVADQFAVEHGLPAANVRMTLAFFCAHYAAREGVLGDPYLRWLDDMAAPVQAMIRAGGGEAVEHNLAPEHVDHDASRLADELFDKALPMVTEVVRGKKGVL